MRRTLIVLCHRKKQEGDAADRSDAALIPGIIRVFFNVGDENLRSRSFRVLHAVPFPIPHRGAYQHLHS